MKLALFILISLNILLSGVSALELGISPPDVKFEGNVNQKICEKIKLFSSKIVSLIGEIKMSEENNRDLTKYTLKEEGFDIEFEYPKKIENFTETEIEVCVTGVKEGEYSGVILYRGESSSVGVGSWLSVSLSRENESQIVRLNLGKTITAASVGIGLEENVALFVLIFSLLFMIMGLMLIYVLRKILKNKPNF